MAIARTITNNGLKELTKLHASIIDPTKQGKAFEYIGIGTGGNTPMVTDTGLQTEVKSGIIPIRKKASITTDPDITGDPEETTVMYTATWNPGEVAFYFIHSFLCSALPTLSSFAERVTVVTIGLVDS